MIRRPPRSTRTNTLFPYTTLFRSWRNAASGLNEHIWVITPDRREDDAADTQRRRRSVANPRSVAIKRSIIGTAIFSGAIGAARPLARSEEGRAGKECVSTCRFRRSTYPSKNNILYDANNTPQKTTATNVWNSRQRS